MSDAVWKAFERRIVRALGGQRRGPEPGSDDDGTVFFSVECKRSKRKVPEGRWIEQAKRQGKADGRPWILVVGGHNDSRPIVVMDFLTFAQIAQEAGRVPELEIAENE